MFKELYRDRSYTLSTTKTFTSKKCGTTIFVNEIHVERKSDNDFDQIRVYVNVKYTDEVDSSSVLARTITKTGNDITIKDNTNIVDRLGRDMFDTMMSVMSIDTIVNSKDGTDKTTDISIKSHFKNSIRNDSRMYHIVG